jgi:hypothetical protein
MGHIQMAKMPLTAAFSRLIHRCDHRLDLPYINGTHYLGVFNQLNLDAVHRLWRLARLISSTGNNSDIGV